MLEGRSLSNQRDHLALICQGQATWRRVVFPFLARGIDRQERCLYLTCQHTPSMIQALLAQECVDVVQAQASGQFSVDDAGQVFLRSMSFEPEQALERLSEAAYQALGLGFSGLRVVADMAWLAERPQGWQMVEEYERRLDRELCGLFPLKAICLYDAALLGTEFLDLARRTHQLVLGGAAGLPAPPRVDWAPAALSLA